VELGRWSSGGVANLFDLCTTVVTANFDTTFALLFASSLFPSGTRS
jgi:transcriptional regulator GlxA family with amidase domain